jgi:Zn-dependent metalloprotease
MSHTPISCFLPPHVLARIIQHGTDLQRQRASQTANQSNQFRLQRLAVPRMAESGPLVAQAGVKQRTVYNANYLSTLPGTLVRPEGSPPSGDAAVDEAYDGAGATYDLYWQVYQRDSINGSGMPINSSVHYQKGYDNAFWNGQQMVYGDGDEDLPVTQRLFNRFTIAIDVMGHELTHGVTQYTSNLNYADQSGALNESFSDVFGSLVKQRHLGQSAAAADWIIGQGLFTSNVNGVGIRSMKAPGTAYNDPVLGKDPQPAQMKDFVNTTDDNGGVHINSGIPNHAFYLAAIELGGNAWDKAGRIWYLALQRIQPTATFQDAANTTFSAAGELYGANSLEQQAISKAWAGVGISVTVVPPTTNPGCLPSLLKLIGMRSG